EQQAAVGQPFELRMPPRNGWVRQENVAIGRAADGESRLAAGEDFLDGPGAARFGAQAGAGGGGTAHEGFVGAAGGLPVIQGAAALLTELVVGGVGAAAGGAGFHTRVFRGPWSRALAVVLRTSGSDVATVGSLVGLSARRGRQATVATND